MNSKWKIAGYCTIAALATKQAFDILFWIF